ncbi:MAG TPA: hypothetical protein VEO74_10325 [Thermoanaerobaculia bacterium]|nr:hypothetical protein [Thermoanaerobaculia bacterium]
MTTDEGGRLHAPRAGARAARAAGEFEAALAMMIERAGSIVDGERVVHECRAPCHQRTSFFEKAPRIDVRSTSVAMRFFRASSRSSTLGLRRNIVDVAPYPVAAFAILYFIQAVRYWRVGTQLSVRGRK